MNELHTAGRKLLILRGPDRGYDCRLDVLGQLGEVHVVDSIDAALETLRGEQFDFVVSETSDFLPLERATVSQKAQVVLDTIAQGVCVTDSDGRLLWSNAKFDQSSPDVVDYVRAMCAKTYAYTAGVLATQAGGVRARRFQLHTADDRYFEINITPILDHNGNLCQVAAVVFDSTSARTLQQKIDAIDKAGQELVRIDADTITSLDVRQRLELLENQIIRYTRDLMRFKNFAIRLLDKKTQKLELVLHAGLPPEAQQIDLYASTEGNGISGYVAATGRSYICPDIRSDPRYVRGIDKASSSLTVPLRLHDQIIGVFNVESEKPAAFNEDDRQFAEIFGRHVAIALHILDLLVVERHHTTGRLASDVSAEICGPLEEILSDVTTLREDYIGHDDMRHRLNAIGDNVARIRDAVRSVTQPPCSLIGHRDDHLQADPLLRGKRVLVADDEEIIRDTIRDVLSKLGCDVDTACDGIQAVEMIGENAYELVLSDIKMPNRNGYEVFAAAKTANAQCSVIFMTGFGYDPNHSIIRARQEGLSAVLFKPFKVDQLLTEVRTALAPA